MALSLPAALEAVLFASGEPLSKKRLGALLQVKEEMLEAAIEDLSGALANRGLMLVATAEEVELRTAGDAAELVKRLRESELSRDLGKAGLEALAIIAYQPEGATRSDIDWIRGVNSGAALRSLLMRGLVERSEDTGDRRRARFQVTIDALAHLGVSKAEDLPRFDDMRRAIARMEEAAETGPAEAETPES